MSAIIFLATPHRGSSLAQTCNNILKAAPGYSIKQYVMELEKGSNTLQDINEQFRSVCGGLELVSFYETLKTNLGVGFKKMVELPSPSSRMHLTLQVINVGRSSIGIPHFWNIPARLRVLFRLTIMECPSSRIRWIQTISVSRMS